jgi:biopolymer transport protein ExbD
MGYGPQQKESSSGTTAAVIVAILLVVFLITTFVVGVGAFLLLAGKRSTTRTVVITQQQAMAEVEKARAEAMRAQAMRAQAMAKADAVEVQQLRKQITSSFPMTLKPADITVVVDRTSYPVEVARDGTITVEGESMGLNAFKSHLKELKRKSSNAFTLVLEVEADCPVKHLTPLLDMCEEVGDIDYRVHSTDESGVSDEPADPATSTS